MSEDLGAAVGRPACDSTVAPFADDQPALQIERRAIALAGIRPHELGLLARRQAVQMTPANVDEIVEAVGMPQGPFGEDEARGQAFGIARCQDRRQIISHRVTPLTGGPLPDDRRPPVRAQARL